MENVAQISLALLLTVLIEGLVLLLLGEKRRRVLLSSVVINIFTNVPLNLIIRHVGMSVTAVAVGEAVVVAVEALWYYFFVRRASQAAVYSLLCNGVSFLTGVIIVALCQT